MKDILQETICKRIKAYLEENANLTQNEKNGVEKVISTVYDMLTDLSSITAVAQYFDLTEEEIRELKDTDESIERLESQEYYKNVLAPQLESLNRD